jgi:hypothetical protein
MENGIGALLDGFGAHFSSHRSKQRQQLCLFAQGLASLAPGPACLPGLRQLHGSYREA